MPTSPLLTRRRLLLGLVVLVLAVAAVVAVVALRSDADPAAGATTSASPTAASDGAGSDAAEPAAGKPSPDGTEPSAASSDADQADEGSKSNSKADKAAALEPRETLAPKPFGAEATPEPGVTVTVPTVEEVTGEANLPGEVGGPALRFTIDLTNGTDKTLDLRTVVVNAYYGPDRTPAAQLLKPGGKAFASEVGVDRTARGAFVFNVPAESQDKVELEIDAGVGKAIVIFAGT